MDYKLPHDKELENINEEFNNFLHRATEVHEIVKKLCSTDEEQQNYGILEADKILSSDKSHILENVDENDITLRIKNDRTVLNRKALHQKDTKADGNTMDKDSFMDEVSKDADKRYKDRLVRTEKMETFKMQATKAFRRGEYERALCCYNKAIEQIKDSPLLYNNRALTQIKLKFYNKALEDLHWALRLNESCLRSFLLQAKCYHYLGKKKQFDQTIAEAKKKNPKQVQYIEEFIQELNAEGN